MNSVQFLDRLLQTLSNQETIVHKSDEQGYEYLGEGVCVEVVLTDNDNIFIELLDEINVKQGEKNSVFYTFEYGDTYEQNYIEAECYIEQLLNK